MPGDHTCYPVGAGFTVQQYGGPPMPSPYSSAVERAALPEVMFAESVSLALQMGEAEADRLMRDGRCGPFFYVGGRVAILRRDFLETLTLYAANQHELAP